MDGPEARTSGPEDGLYDGFIAKPCNLGNLLQRISELFKLDLIAEAPKVHSAPPPGNIDELIGQAEIGHAGAVRAGLDRLEAANSGLTPQLRPVRALLREFDMTGVAASLKEWRDAGG